MYEKLDRRTFIERRNELDRQKLQKLREEEAKKALQNDDDEQ